MKTLVLILALAASPALAGEWEYETHNGTTYGYGPRGERTVEGAARRRDLWRVERRRPLGNL
jgi:hypothetical protein